MSLASLLTLIETLSRGDELLEQLGLSSTFVELLEAAKHGYRPTCRGDIDPRYIELADTYDSAQELLGCSVRAFRG
jgi:hypothetical protein